MTWIDVLIIIGAVLIVGGTIAASIVRKKKGQTGCGCGCASCPSAGACSMAKKQAQETENAQENQPKTTKEEENV